MKTTWKQNGRRAGGGEPFFSRGERRRLMQLGVSTLLFGLALLGRSAVPGQFEYWNEILNRDADFEAAFTQLGEAAARGEPILDALGELCVQVFAGESGIRETGGVILFEDALPISRRIHVWQEETIPLWKGR